ncbi:MULTISPECIES: dihydroxyacetone kinase family protein [Brucella/Ochrobactrum group]|jgi:dihydroxyacetone kinase-like protein|uniref:Dihydroxyacetone kinase subunit L n=1 Tax=Brucella pseudintermedia TaxID=370111 RepID=A0ABY5UEZ0_9HYPH|nr:MULTISPECIES: dihydroxyacetone kinase subunit L [Brucella/Ochrobactrum group]KAB2677445.1 dihydroxyacetone kinase subunit L [Brucella pseudintermedia]NKE74500.1 dihydroxyacetone kinase subunit L [Ochrobactrum sp. MC-1LL]TWH02783.1 dihydroxyacetone kinase-like protein [Ochrobactrum sp. J50]UWL61914.1 dihydroxyacetone kinase subunit L [Brucella pseudintermedia]WPM82380.1 dihydroxyacetone kinase subunit L [Brucella pseudintermedia]
MNVITASDLISLFDNWKQLFAEQREFLIALDGKVGDSDLGITMSKAFAAAAEALHAEGEAAGIAKLLRTAGVTMARVAPSTMGTLTATGFLRASKACDGIDALDTAEIAAFWRAYRDGIAERGKAKVGDKTLLDVLDPIAVTLEAQTTAGASLANALAAAAKAAEDALEATKTMVAQHGKAAAFQEKTVGLQDAGATVGMLLITSMSAFVSAS